MRPQIAETRRPRRRSLDARAAGLRHRPAVAPQPAAVSQVADRGGDRGRGRAAVSPAPPSCCSGRGRAVARLYSIAVAPQMGGRGVGAMLLAAAEAAALARDCRAMRLEVHETNHAAISRYRKSGYREFGRHARYYEDGGDALRFEKRLTPRWPGSRRRRAYFHQTTEFTCGPACIMMALAWADRVLQAGAGLRVPALARGHHHLHELGPGRLRALWPGGHAQAPRPRAGGLCEPPRSLFPRYRPVGGQAPRHAVTQSAISP